MRYPLIDFHGSNGSQLGDGPAAYRYTESRLAKLVEDGMLTGIKKDKVDFMPTYDEQREEPTTLPSIFPNLLCNPNNGIGISLTANWLCHNLREVAQAIYDYMDGKEPTLPGPDFPTGGVIINKNDLPTIIKKGHGSVKIRGKYRIDGNKIIFYEIPYGQTVEGLLEDIGAACEEDCLSDIKDIRDESSKKGVRIVLECNKNANLDKVVKTLFAKTNLQTNVSYNQVALVNKIPTELGLKDCIQIYLKHNIDCLKREKQFEYDKAKQRFMIVRGMLVALGDIKNVMQLIKNSKSSNEAKVKLMDRYNLIEEQALAILNMKLSRLAHLEKLELENEEQQLLDLMESCRKVLRDGITQLVYIKKQLQNLVERYGDDRRTELAQIDEEPEEEEKIEIKPEKCVVVLTEGGSIRRVSEVQKRSNKKVKTRDDITSMVLRTNTADSLMVFTNKGKLYRLLVNDIPAGTKGQSVRNLVSMQPNEQVSAVYSIYGDTDAKYAVFITKQGMVKKTSLEEYIKMKRAFGADTIKLRDGDSLASVLLMKDEPLILATRMGQVIKFNSSDIAPIGRMTTGTKGIKLKPDDEVIVGLPLKNPKSYLGIFTKSSTGKRIKIAELLTQKKGGMGIRCCLKDEEVTSACLISEEDKLLVCGNRDSICVSAAGVPVVNRAMRGSLILNKDIIKTVNKI